MDSTQDSSNVKVLIQRIVSYSLHCDPSKKLGAALIFNNVYAILREEDTLFNLYWLEILYAFVMSLEVTDINLLEDTCFLEQVNQALDHVQRGFVEKSDRFNKRDKDRRLPPYFKDSLLKDVAEFLFKHTASRNQYCRAKCMQMFCSVRNLIAKCDRCNDKTDCLHIIDEPEEFYQGDLLEKPEIKSFHDIFEWMHDFYRALDGHIYILQNHFVDKIDVEKSARFLSALKYFLNCIAIEELSHILTETPFSVTEKEAFKTLKLKIVLQAINFVMFLLQVDFLQEFWNDFLPNLVCNIVFEPQRLGLELNNIDTSYRQIAFNLLQIIKNTQPQNFLTNIETAISSFVINKQLAPTNFKRNIPLKQRLLVKGIILLHESKFSTRINLQNIVQQVFEALFEKNSTTQVKVVNIYNDTFQKYYEAMLQLAFFSEVEKRKIAEYFFNTSQVNVLNSYKTTTCGQYFFELFKSIVIPKFLDDFDLFLDVAFAQSNLRLTVEYITEFLIYLDNNKNVNQKNVCESVLKNWIKFQSLFNESFANLQQGLDFIKKLVYVVPFAVYWIGKPEYGIAEWILTSLMREDLEFPLEIIFNFRTQIYELIPCISGMFDEEHVKLR